MRSVALDSKSLFLFCAFILCFLSGCDVREGTIECAGKVNVGFYSQTACENVPYYPVTIQHLDLFIFDENDLLVHQQKYDDVQLSAAYNLSFALDEGLYTIIAWSGLNNTNFSIPESKLGVTRKKDLLFRLNRNGIEAPNLIGEYIFYGESPAVYLPLTSKKENVKAIINMQEITNRLVIIVEGLDNAGDYEIDIESRNGAMNVNGTIAVDDMVDYTSESLIREGILEASFTLLKLETGHDDTIIIRQKTSGKELYRGNLLGTLLLKNPEVDLACDHDFEIRFTAKDQCDCGEYAITEVWVNNWLVNSYDTEF